MIEPEYLSDLKYKLIRNVNNELKHCMVQEQVIKIIKSLRTVIEVNKEHPEIHEILIKLIDVNCERKLKYLKLILS